MIRSALAELARRALDARSHSVKGAYFMVAVTGQELLDLVHLAQAALPQADDHPAAATAHES